MFYNTIKLNAVELAKATATAETQDERVLLLVKAFNNPPTPSEVWREYLKYYPKSTPITSIRRSLSTLTKDGKLEKLDEMRDGEYGKPEHTWRIPPPPVRKAQIPGTQKALF